MEEAYVLGLGDVRIEQIFICGAYKWGYVGTVLVRYDYGTKQWTRAIR